MRSYATIKRGKVKMKIGGAQDKYLHTKALPHSHVHFIKPAKASKRSTKLVKRITRYPK
jgi:hypothetical protein